MKKNSRQPAKPFLSPAPNHLLQENIWPQTNLWFQIEINVGVGFVAGLVVAIRWFFSSLFFLMLFILKISSLATRVHSLTKHLNFPLLPFFSSASSSSWWRLEKEPEYLHKTSKRYQRWRVKLFTMNSSTQTRERIFQIIFLSLSPSSDCIKWTDTMKAGVFLLFRIEGKTCCLNLSLARRRCWKFSHSHFTFSRRLQHSSCAAARVQGGFDFTLNWRFSTLELNSVLMIYSLASVQFGWLEHGTLKLHNVSCKMWGNMMSTFFFFFRVLIRWYEIWGSEISPSPLSWEQQPRRRKNWFKMLLRQSHSVIELQTPLIPHLIVHVVKQKRFSNFFPTHFLSPSVYFFFRVRNDKVFHEFFQLFPSHWIRATRLQSLEMMLEQLSTLYRKITLDLWKMKISWFVLRL